MCSLWFCCFPLFGCVTPSTPFHIKETISIICDVLEERTWVVYSAWSIHGYGCCPFSAVAFLVYLSLIVIARHVFSFLLLYASEVNTNLYSRMWVVHFDAAMMTLHKWRSLFPNAHSDSYLQIIQEGSISRDSYSTLQKMAHRYAKYDHVVDWTMCSIWSNFACTGRLISYTPPYIARIMFLCNVLLWVIVKLLVLVFDPYISVVHMHRKRQNARHIRWYENPLCLVPDACAYGEYQGLGRHGIPN